MSTDSWVELHTLPEFVVVPPVVNKTTRKVPGHHELKRSTSLVLIIDGVHLNEAETKQRI